MYVLSKLNIIEKEQCNIYFTDLVVKKQLLVTTTLCDTKHNHKDFHLIIVIPKLVTTYIF